MAKTKPLGEIPRLRFPVPRWDILTIEAQLTASQLDKHITIKAQPLHLFISRYAINTTITI